MVMLLVGGLRPVEKDYGYLLGRGPLHRVTISHFSFWIERWAAIAVVRKKMTVTE